MARSEGAQQVRASVDTIPIDVAPDQPSTRDAILAAALGRFAESGYEGASLGDIAADVGIRKPSLLHHFPSKEALYGEVFEQLLSDWFERLASSMSSSETGWVKVEQVLHAGFQFFADNPSYVRLMRREAIDGGTHLAIDLAGVLRPLFEKAVSYFERNMAAGTFTSQNPQQLLVTGYGALLSYFSDAPFIAGLIDEDPLSASALAAREAHIVEFFRAALVPRLDPAS